MSPRVKRALAFAASLTVATGAGYVLVRDLRGLHVADVRAAARSIPAWRLVASAVLTASSFACLATLEWIGCRALEGRPVPRGHALRTGAIAHALCNTLGVHAVLAPAVRLALYRPQGVRIAAIGQVLAIVAGGIATGVAGLALLGLGGRLGHAPGAILAFLAIVLSIACWNRVARRATATRVASRLFVAGPSALGIGLAESVAAFGALYVLLPHDAIASPAHVVLAFCVAGAAGVVSHAPGGLGVFEAMMLGALPGDRAQILAALLAYRCVYNLAPGAIAALAFVAAGTRAPAAQFDGG